MSDRRFYVVAYDIPDDRRRARVHRTLTGFGRWTQYSVFEVWATDKELVLLHDRLQRVLRAERDSVRIYPLCQRCRAEVWTVGGSPPEEPWLFIV